MRRPGSPAAFVTAAHGFFRSARGLLSSSSFLAVPRYMRVSTHAWLLDREGGTHSGAWLSQIRACNFGIFGTLGTFFIDGLGDRIASQVLQLCEECVSASFDRLSRLVKDCVSAR
jgi:hypothetical protein